MPRILMFAPAFAPEMASEALVNRKLAVAMLRRGWDLQVITRRGEGFRYSEEWEEPWLELKPHTHVLSHGTQGRVRRLWERFVCSIRLRYPIAGVRWACDAIKCAAGMHRQQPFDVVLSRLPADYGHLPALHFTAATGLPWIANWNDPVAGCWPAPYGNGPRNLSRRFWDHYLRRAGASARRNTFPCQRLAACIVKHLGMPEADSARVVPHVWLDGYEPPSYRKTSKFRICHAGNMSAERDPTLFLRALKRLIDGDGNGAVIELIIVGVENAGLRRAIDDLGLTEHVTFAGQMDYLQSLECLAQSDVLLLLEAPCDEGIFLPGKLTDYASVQRAILAVSPCKGTITEILAECGGGVACDCTSEDSIHAVLAELLGEWQRGELPSRVSTRLRDQFSPGRTLTIYESLFAEAAGQDSDTRQGVGR